MPRGEAQPWWCATLLLGAWMVGTGGVEMDGRLAESDHELLVLGQSGL